MESSKHEVPGKRTQKHPPQKRSLYQTELNKNYVMVVLLSVAHSPVSELSVTKGVCSKLSLKHCNKNSSSVLGPDWSMCQ